MVVVQPKPGVRLPLAGLFRFPEASEGPRLTHSLAVAVIVIVVVFAVRGKCCAKRGSERT